MTIRKKNSQAYIGRTVRGVVLGAMAASLAGCGMINSVVEADKLDYKGEGAKKVQSLEVPPDLTQLSKDNRYALPDTNKGVATASDYNQARSGAPTAAAAAPVAAAAPMSGNVRVERSGNQRWLVIKQTPEALWPKLKEFWQDNGFTLLVDMPTAGIMETDWAENRAKIPQDLIRRTIGKVFDSLYSTGERDKFRTRVERAADGSTEIYISHRGAEEVFVGREKDTTTWTTRRTDPGLEAQLLAKLMARLTDTEAPVAKMAVENATLQVENAKLLTGADGKYVEVNEGFDRAWRRVGLALDRVGFTVEDRDRVQGTYFVRFVDPDGSNKAGFFARLFSFSASEKEKEAQRYRISVKAAAGAGTTSSVTVQNKEGKPEVSPTADKILGLLTDQLK